MKIMKNPNAEKYKVITAAVEANQGYCPCALIKSEETKCICQNFLKEVNHGYKGECECGRYISY